MTQFGWAGHLWQAAADFQHYKLVLFITGVVHSNLHQDNRAFRPRTDVKRNKQCLLQISYMGNVVGGDCLVDLSFNAIIAMGERQRRQSLPLLIVPPSCALYSVDGGSIKSSVQFPVSGFNITEVDLQYNLVGTVHYKQNGPNNGHYTSMCKSQ